MTATRTDAAQVAMYEALARHVWHRRGGRPAGEALELHKRLRAPRGDGPAAGTAGLHDWLSAFAGASEAGAVLDVGCGFGATLLRWAAAQPFRGLGIAPSPFQIARAREQAAALRLSDRCEFRAQGVDALPPDAFDLAIAVESLCHMADWPAVLAALARALRPGGMLAVVDDFRVAGANGSAFAHLAAAWHSPELRTVAALRAAADAVGLAPVAERDLTAQVPRRTRWWCRLGSLALRGAAAIAPSAARRAVLTAFAGGLELEFLYGSGRARYLAVSFRRGSGA